MRPRTDRRFLPGGPALAPLEARTVPTAMMMMATAGTLISPWPYLDPYNRVPTALLPDPSIVAPIGYWARLYGLGQIELQHQQALATMRSLGAEIDRMEADAPDRDADPEAWAMYDRAIVAMSGLVGNALGEVARTEGLAAWWASLPVSDPENGVFP